MEKNYRAIIEAILFTMGESVELSRIAEAIELEKKFLPHCLPEDSQAQAALRDG